MKRTGSGQEGKRLGKLQAPIPPNFPNAAPFAFHKFL